MNDGDMIVHQILNRVVDSFQCFKGHCRIVVFKSKSYTPGLDAAEIMQQKNFIQKKTAQVIFFIKPEFGRDRSGKKFFKLSDLHRRIQCVFPCGRAFFIQITSGKLNKNVLFLQCGLFFELPECLFKLPPKIPVKRHIFKMIPPQSIWIQ